MKYVALSSLAALACLTFALPSRSASPAAPSAASTFRREPVIVYTNDLITPAGPQSVSLIVYQDGFVTVSRAGDSTAGTEDNVASGNVGVVKATSWFRGLISFGAAELPDGPSPDPTGNGAATLTVFEPGPNAWSHTFSYGPGDYPRIERLVTAILLRLNV